jgi:multicomponent Na+:H+ antiporter subunit G
MSDVIGYTLIVLGILFNIFGCVGLQASTKCVTLGTVLLLVGVAIANGTGAMAAKAVICAVFVLVTSPTAAHAIAKGAYASGVPLWEGTVVDKYAERAKPQEPSSPVA